MKALYLRLLALLGAVTQLRYIDLDKGQLDYYEQRPSVAFPCALIRIDLPRITAIGKGVQRFDVQVTIRLAFDFIGEANARTPEATRLKSLSYFDTLEAVNLAIHEQEAVQKHPFYQTSVREETRQDGLKIVQIAYSTNYVK